MKPILFLLLISCSICNHAQITVKDSLVKISNNVEKLDYLGNEIKAQFYSNPQKVVLYAQIYDSISQVVNTPLSKANALNYRGTAYHLTQAYDLAIENYLEAIRILEKTKEDERLIVVYNNLAGSYKIRNDFKNTEKYFKKALDNALLAKDNRWIANLNNNLAVLYMENEFYNKADLMFDEALSYYKNLNDSIMMGITYMNHGNSRISNKDYARAIVKYDNAMTLINDTQIPLVHAVSQTGIGIALTKQKNFDEAESFLKKGLEISKSINHLEQSMESHTALGDFYYETNQYKKAYDLAIYSHKLKDSILTSAQDQNMAEALTKYETEKKDVELKLLKTETEKKEQEKRLYSILAASGILIACLLGLFGYRNRKKNILLAKQKKLLEATVDEKNVLLKETHHRVKNSFQIVSSLLYLQSESVEDKEAKIAIKEAENRVRSMVLIHQRLYSKDELVGINTKDYFNDLVRDIFESHQFESQPIQYQIDVEPLVLDIETTTPIGLILNELIVNTLKHAFNEVTSESKITIKFRKETESLVLKVIDNGQGFKGDVKNTSFGITLMKALSKKLNAALSYKSEINKGTEATLVIKKYKLL